MVSLIGDIIAVARSLSLPLTGHPDTGDGRFHQTIFINIYMIAYSSVAAYGA